MVVHQIIKETFCSNEERLFFFWGHLGVKVILIIEQKSLESSVIEVAKKSLILGIA